MLKKETRILGISSRHGLRGKVLVVGAVFRGSLWLDGLITCTVTEQQEAASQIAQTLMRSRYRSQIRAVILSSRANEISVKALARQLRLPVIALQKKTRLGTLKGAKGYRFRFRGRRVSVQAAGTDNQGILEIFGVSCAKGDFQPEAARVADLVCRNLPNDFLLQEIK